MLRNLISTSLKFTERGGSVTMLAEYVEDGLPRAVILQAPRRLLANARAGVVRITVKDDGPGLSPAQVADIGKKGVQFNANTLQSGGGSGLGIFIGKGIVEQLGGEMWVFSEGLGKGATFVIELPLFEVEEPTQDPLSPITTTSDSKPDDPADLEAQVELPIIQNQLSSSLSVIVNRASPSVGILETGPDTANGKEDEIMPFHPKTNYILVVDDGTLQPLDP
jgi:hypothetical protein